MLDEEQSMLSKGTDTLKNAMTNASEVFNDDFGRPKPSIIISFLLLLVVIYLIIYYYRQAKYSPYLILDITSTMSTGKPTFEIPSGKIPDSVYSNEYSYSMWVYVSSDTSDNTIGQNNSTKRIILSRRSGSDYKMVYALDNNKRKLLIRYKTTTGPPGLCDSSDLLGDCSNMVKCDIENFKYDTFVHLAVVVYGKSIVVYINGILVKTVVYHEKLSILKTNDIIDNKSSNTYSAIPGWISKLRYFVDISKENGGALNDKQVYDLYLNGPYPSLFTRVVHTIVDKLVSHSSDGNKESPFAGVDLDSIIQRLPSRDGAHISRDQWDALEEAVDDLKNDDNGKVNKLNKLMDVDKHILFPPDSS
jgi:hypothetical protein